MKAFDSSHISCFDQTHTETCKCKDLARAVIFRLGLKKTDFQSNHFTKLDTFSAFAFPFFYLLEYQNKSSHDFSSLLYMHIIACRIDTKSSCFYQHSAYHFLVLKAKMAKKYTSDNIFTSCAYIFPRM